MGIQIQATIRVMLNAINKQFSLNTQGQVLFQRDASNPLPGQPIARLKKGQQALMPEVDLDESDLISGLDNGAVKEKLSQWLSEHIAEVLEPLVKLQETDDLPGPVKGICFQVYESMGIVPREGLEDLIKDLDGDMRQALRHKNVRLGPILVFVPALNKPAAVKLRGLLWALWNEKSLPVELPKDGVVSFQIDKASVDRNFHQAIGYPVFGPRAIRIDMLDRVICAVYDSAEQGKFQAQHKMAEWLGSSIDDLYAVLGAMGHKQIIEKAAEAPVVEENAQPGETVNAEEQKTGEPSPEEAPEVETPKAVETLKEQGDVKPDLAWFYLKKGKAFERQQSSKKPHYKKGKDERPKGKHQKGQNKKTKDKGPRVIQTGPKPKLEDSPFAILEQLKEKKS